MKKSIFLISVILLGILVTTIYSCEETPKETCLQDEICTAKFVSACCDDNNVCVYTYDGKEYTEAEKDQLAIDMGCGNSSKAEITIGNGDDLTTVVTQLKALMVRVKEQIKASK